MFESKNKKEALKHIVHITYNRDSEGSGVIVPVKGKDYSYVLTAKHTFGKDDDERGDNYYLIKKINIKSAKIILYTDSKEKLEVDDIFILDENPELDFLIIKVKNDTYINGLKQLDIYEEDFNYCLPYGYPESEKDGHTNYEPFNCEYKPISSPDKLEIRIMEYMSVKANKGTNSYMSGISGAGVFVENYNKDTLYLVGIVIQGTETIKQNLVCLDLEKLSKKINDSLKEIGWEVLNVSGAEWKNKFGFDMSDLNFEKEIEEFKEKSKNKFIKALKDEENFVDKFDNDVKGDLKKEEEKFQKISESYLYIGMNFHQLQSHKRATHYLNKAIEYGGNKNKSYLLDAKSKREEEKTIAHKTEQEKELMLGFINSLYQEIYEYEEQLIHNEKDESIKRLLIDLYDKLIKKLKFFDDRKDEILEIHEKSIQLYSDFNEYDDINEKITTLENMIDLNKESTISMKNQVNDYQQEIENLNKHIQLLSTHVSDKTLLNQINYRVFNTDKKLDTVSKDISTKIDTNTNKLTKKLDEVKVAIIKTNNQKLNSFLENVYRSNQALASKIQMMYHQNDRVNRKAKITLNESILSMNKKINELLTRPIPESSNNDIQNIEKIIKKSNWNFYNAIQGLYEKESDSYNRKLLEMSIAFTKREHELHIENLKGSHQNEILRIDNNYQEEVITLKEKMKNLVETLNGITIKYQSIKSVSIEKNEKLISLKKEYEELEKSIENDSKINLTEKVKERFQEKIKVLSRKVTKLENDLLLKDKNINLQKSEFEGKLSSIKLIKSENTLKESLELAKETSWNLLELETDYQKKIKDIEHRFKKIKYNPKNEKRLRKFLKKILNFEKKLEEIRKNNSTESKYDPNITLRLVENDLKKIEKIMNKRKSKIYSYYCLARSVIIGVIAMFSLLLYKPFWEIYKELLHFLSLM
jgi:hypothetical protein